MQVQIAQLPNVSSAMDRNKLSLSEGNESGTASMKKAWCDAFSHAETLTTSLHDAIRLCNLAIACSIACNEGLLALKKTAALDGRVLKEQIISTSLYPFPLLREDSLKWE